MNRFIIQGRLCADPEFRYTQNGALVISFNFAVNRRFKREGDPDADFFRCCCFGKIAEVFQKCNIVKGTKLLLEGEVQNNNYTDNGGVKHYSMQVIVSSIEFCESKSSGQNSQTYTSAYAPAPPAPPNPPMQQADQYGFTPMDFQSEEDLPF